MAQIIDGPQTQLDNTVRVFDSFYNYEAAISADVYEVVNSYFKSVCATKSIANNFTTMLFRIVSITGEDAMTLLANIQGNTKLETTALMAYYLNSLKSKTTLYGVSVVPSPNETVQRNIVT
jgi:hypothetical protein